MAMVYKGFGTGPRSTTQDPRVRAAADEFDRQGGLAMGEQARATEARTAATTRANRVIDQGLARERQTSTVQQAGFSPSYAAQITASMNNAAQLAASMKSGAGSFSPGRTDAFNPNAVKDFRSTNLEGFSADELTDFDPAQYGKEFYQGAQGEFEMGLRDQLEELTNRSAGGRMRTGWFDADRGRVVTDNSRQFANAIQQAAVQFSGQRLDALGRGKQLEFSRASEMDSNARQMSALAAELGLRQATEADQVSLNAALAGDDFALKQLAQKAGIDEAQAKMALAMAQLEADTSQFNAGQANEMVRFDRGQDFAREGLYGGWALDMDQRERTGFESAADRASDWASSTRDWANQDRDFAAAQEQAKWVRDRADAEFANQIYLNNTYIWTDPRTGVQRRLFRNQAPPKVSF